MKNINYVPKFTTTERDGKIALWVEMPNHEKYNIMDISKKDFQNEDLRFSIICSFQRGMEAMKQIITNQSTYCINLKFDE